MGWFDSGQGVIWGLVSPVLVPMDGYCLSYEKGEICFCEEELGAHVEEGRGSFSCLIDSFVSQYAHVRGNPDGKNWELLLTKESSWTRIREMRGWDELVSEMADRAAREEYDECWLV